MNGFGVFAAGSFWATSLRSSGSTECERLAQHALYGLDTHALAMKVCAFF